MFPWSSIPATARTGIPRTDTVIRRTAFWLLLPLTAIQGLWLRRVAVRLPGAEGERSGKTGHSPRLALLALGDSIIDGVGIASIEDAMPVRVAHAVADRSGVEVSWELDGESGHAVADVIGRLHALEPQRPPDLVLLSVGVNDVTGLSSKSTWRSRLGELLGLIRTRWPETRIVFAGLPPMGLFPLPPNPLKFSLGLRAGEFDRIAADLVSRDPGAVHVPTTINPSQHAFCEDGFHPSAESCNLWAVELAQLLPVGESFHDRPN